MRKKVKELLSKAKKTHFIFWKENKVAGEHVISSEDLKAKFAAWLDVQDNSWLEYTDTRNVVLCFIANKDGLNSVHENSKTDTIVDLLKPLYFAYMDNMG